MEATGLCTKRRHVRLFVWEVRFERQRSFPGNALQARVCQSADENLKSVGASAGGMRAPFHELPSCIKCARVNRIRILHTAYKPNLQTELHFGTLNLWICLLLLALTLHQVTSSSGRSLLQHFKGCSSDAGAVTRQSVDYQCFALSFSANSSTRWPNTLLEVVRTYQPLRPQ